MTNLPSSRRACPSCFAHTKRREIVMQNKTLRLFATAVRINHLRFFDGCQGREGECLSFAALKNRGTMCSGQYAYFAADRPQIGVATPIHALLFFQNAGSKRLLFDKIEWLIDRK